MSARLVVRVTPRAGIDRAGPWREGVLQVRVTRPPTGGEANDAVRRVVAEALGLPPHALLLVAGAKARVKRYALDRLTQAELEGRLARLGD